VHDAVRLHPKHVDPTIPMEGRRRTIAMVVLCLCILVATIDVTISNVALPFIGRELDASVSGLQWVIDAYNIVLAGLLVLGGGLADRFGRRRIYLGGFVLFGLACLIAALSTTTGALIAARALMGIGAAGFVSPALAIVASMYPPEERGKAIGLWALFGAAGLAIGPVLGGFLLDTFWWGSVFLVNVPVVAAGVLVGWWVLPDSRKPGTARLDVGGALLSVAGLGLLLFGIIEGPGRGWASPLVLAGLGVGAVTLVAFVRHETRVANPLLDVRVLARPVVAASSATLLMSYVVFTSMLFLVPQWLQDVRGEQIITVGLLLVPFAAVFGIASQASATVLARVGARVTVVGGLAICALGTLLLAFLQESVAGTVVASAVVGIGLAGLIAPSSTVMMNDLPEANAGDGSSLSMVSRFVGAAVGVAVIGSILSSLYTDRLGDAVDDLARGPAAAADRSLQGALEAASTLPRAAGNELTHAAREAFDAGAHAAYLVVAAVAAIAALWVWRALRSRPAA